MDQFDTFGLGKNVPIATGNGEDALLALVNGKWVVLRVPYPIGFFAKGMDGRIDDPKAGWKGKGLWSTYATRAPFHMEGGKGTYEQGAAFPAASRPAGELRATRLKKRVEECTGGHTLDTYRVTPAQFLIFFAQRSQLC